MHLNTFTDLGIRTLLYLALPINEKKSLTISELAESLKVKRMHLVKVIHFMGKKKWIKTIRGRQGGIYLLENTKKLYIGNIISSLENSNKPHTNLIDCEGLMCPIIPICRLPKILEQAQQEFYDSLNKYTLEEIVTIQYNGQIKASNF